MTSQGSRWPSLFPPLVYELTCRMLEHAVHAELADLTIISLTESAATCQLVVDQCNALADCIIERRSSTPWPPAENVLRLFAAATVSGLEGSGEKIARTGPPAATSDAVYAYLARVVVAGEPATEVFPPGESVILPVWTTAAMLVSLVLPGHSWQSHLALIWSLETGEGLNCSALAAIQSRARRQHIRPISDPGGTARQD